MSIVVLEQEEVKSVIGGTEPVNKVNLLGYKSYLKEKYPGQVLYNKYDDQDVINAYLETIIEINNKGNNIVLPYYENNTSIFPDLTHNYFSGVIVGTEYIEKNVRMNLVPVINTFIEMELMTGNLHIGNIDFTQLLK